MKIELPESENIYLSQPNSKDAVAVNSLIESCPPLDTNSLYCNLLQCFHFSETSVCAKKGAELLGFISGYLIPTSPRTLFIWQVAVAETIRGKGLAGKMLLSLLMRPACKKVIFLETTIGPSNESSWRLFRKFAQKLNISLAEVSVFTSEDHFKGLHDSERLIRIGPFNSENLPNINTV